MCTSSVVDVTLTGNVGIHSFVTATSNKPAPTFVEVSQCCMAAAESAPTILLYLKTCVAVGKRDSRM
jgi:hypothetical protein